MSVIFFTLNQDALMSRSKARFKKITIQEQDNFENEQIDQDVTNTSHVPSLRHLNDGENYDPHNKS